MCQSAPIASKRLNRNGIAMRLKRLDEPQSAKAADERQDRAADVDDQRDRRAGRIEAKDVRPRAGQLPEAERIIAIESRRSRTPRRQWRSAPGNTGARLAPSAKAQGRQRLRPPRRSVAAAQPRHKGEREKREAAEPRKRYRAARKRACKSRRRLHAFRAPDSARAFLADCTTESQACLQRRLPVAP